MRLSTTINFFIYPDNDSFDACRADLRHYADLGFSCLDAIFCSAAEKGSVLLTDRWEAWAHAMRAEADALDIAFVQTHLPFYNFCDPKRGVDEVVERVNRRALACTAILGAKWTVAHPATAFAEALPMPASRKRNEVYFGSLLEEANRHRVGICLENMADFAGQGYPRSYCAPVEELCGLVDSLNAVYGNAGVCWDFGHANLFYRDQTACLRYLGKRLKVTHVHDNFGSRDDHLVPFRGTVDWHALMPVLKEIGYEGDFSFEVRRILAPGVPEAIKDSLWRHMKLTGEYLLTLAEAGNPGAGR